MKKSIMAVAAKSYVAMLLLGNISLNEYQAVEGVKLGSMTKMQENAMAAIELGLDLDAEETERIQAQLRLDEQTDMSTEQFLSFNPKGTFKRPASIDLAAIKESVAKTSSTHKKKKSHKDHAPKDNAKVMTTTDQKQKDSELMSAAIQLVTTQPTPEAQAQMAEQLASQMTEEQKQELMAQLEGGAMSAPAAIPAPPPAVPVNPITASPVQPEPSLAEKQAIAAEITAAVPGATQADIDEAVKSYQMQNQAAGISSSSVAVATPLALTTMPAPIASPATPIVSEIKPPKAPEPKVEVKPASLAVKTVEKKVVAPKTVGPAAPGLESHSSTNTTTSAPSKPSNLVEKKAETAVKDDSIDDLEASVAKMQKLIQTKRAAAEAAKKKEEARIAKEKAEKARKEQAALAKKAQEAKEAAEKAEAEKKKLLALKVKETTQKKISEKKAKADKEEDDADDKDDEEEGDEEGGDESEEDADENENEKSEEKDSKKKSQEVSNAKKSSKTEADSKLSQSELSESMKEQMATYRKEIEKQMKDEVKKHDEATLSKMKTTLSELESKAKQTEKDNEASMKKLSQKFEDDLAKVEEQYKKELDAKDQELANDHASQGKEERDLFQNASTLKFVKDMRFFKKQWAELKTVRKRKKIAAAMANATKAWVSDGEKMQE